MFNPTKMIRFFRGIRGRLLHENRFTKYLLYAIGEIVLVVIGILIALSINGWNQDRLDKKRAIEYHQRLIEDMDRVIERSNTINERSNKTLQTITNSVRVLENGVVQNPKEQEDLDYALVWFSRFNYQTPDLSTLEEMKSNGDLNLIYNIELRKQIVDFNGYLYSVTSIFDNLGMIVSSELSYFDKFMRSHVDPKTLDVTFSYDFDSMAMDPEFINRFSRVATHWRGSAYFTGRVTKEALDLKEAIQTELNKLE